MYSPFDNYGDDGEGSSFLSKNSIILAYCNNAEKAIELELILAKTRDSHSLYTSLLKQVFEVGANMHNPHLLRLAEKMGFWQMDDMAGNPLIAEYLYLKSSKNNNNNDDQVNKMLVQAASCCSREEISSLIYIGLKPCDDDEHRTQVAVRFANLIETYGLLCSQAGIIDEIAIGHILDALEDTQIITEPVLADSFLEVMAKVYPNWIPELEWIERFNKLSESDTPLSRRLHDNSMREVIRNTSLSSSTLKESSALSTAMIRHPEEMLALLLRSTHDEVLSPRNKVLLIAILHGNWLNDKAELIPQFAVWLNGLVKNERFRHCEGRHSEISCLTGRVASIVTYQALSAAGIGSDFIVDITKSSSVFFRHLLLNEKTVGDVDFTAMLNTLAHSHDGRFLAKIFDRVVDNGESDLKKDIEAVEKIKVAACMILSEIAHKAELKGKKDDTRHPWHSAAQIIKGRTSNPLANLDSTFIAVTLAMNPDEMIKAAGESSDFIKYMLMKKILPEHYISKLPAKDRKSIIASDMGL